MSFVMIATGSTSSASRVRNVSIRSLLLGGGFAAGALLAAGFALGCWLAPSTATQKPDAAPQRSASTMPFALEQLGALSGRLFKLESQASQLSERLGATN